MVEILTFYLSLNRIFLTHLWTTVYIGATVNASMHLWSFCWQGNGVVFVLCAFLTYEFSENGSSDIFVLDLYHTFLCSIKPDSFPSRWYLSVLHPVQWNVSIWYDWQAHSAPKGWISNIPWLYQRLEWITQCCKRQDKKEL